MLSQELEGVQTQRAFIDREIEYARKRVSFAHLLCIVTNTKKYQNEMSTDASAVVLAYIPPMPQLALPRREDFPETMPESVLNVLRSLLSSMERTQTYIESEQNIWNIARKMSEADLTHLYHSSPFLSHPVVTESHNFPPPFQVPAECGL